MSEHVEEKNLPKLPKGTLDVEMEADAELSDNEGPDELLREANDNELMNMDVEEAIDNNFLMPI